MPDGDNFTLFKDSKTELKLIQSGTHMAFTLALSDGLPQILPLAEGTVIGLYNFLEDSGLV